MSVSSGFSLELSKKCIHFTNVFPFEIPSAFRFLSKTNKKKNLAYFTNAVSCVNKSCRHNLEILYFGWFSIPHPAASQPPHPSLFVTHFTAHFPEKECPAFRLSETETKILNGQNRVMNSRDFPET